MDPHSGDNKAISAPSWGLAGWLRKNSVKFDSLQENVKNLINFQNMIKFFVLIVNDRSHTFDLIVAKLDLIRPSNSDISRGGF